MIIAPSLLASNYARFADEVKRVAKAKADWLHIDIMDGHFVPNLSFGPALVKALRPLTRMFFDVHLMCDKPEILLEPFRDSGANNLTVHVELGDRVLPLLWRIKSLGVKAGLAINPPTGITHVTPYLDKIDLLLIMTVNPGYGGQSFIEETIPKVQQAATWRRERGLNYRIEVDGGITNETAFECARSGADTFVAGTALFGKRQLAKAVAKMRKRVTEGAAFAEAARPQPAQACG